MNYDDRYLAGVLRFNRGDFFESHEVWESLWLEGAGPDRRFIQGLIQAAVGLVHFGNGNLRGAAKLYHTSRAYMDGYPSPHWGLNVADFWRQMERCFAGLLRPGGPDPGVERDEALLPRIVLDPPPAAWPDPEDFTEEAD
jgi:hypothetical protein